MPADLHLHTIFSDGTETPEMIVELAKKKGLTAIAITDHDVIAGIEPAHRRGAELGLEIVPGIEFTSEAGGAEIHILGYFIDLKNEALLAKLAQLQKSREERIYKICDKLKNLNLLVDPEKVFAIAGHRAAGRPHVAQALLARGDVKSVKEAFDRFLDNRGPAYVEHYKLSPTEAVGLINAVKGLAVYAHPAVSNCDKIIPELTAAGLTGIEAYYSGHDNYLTNFYIRLAEKYGLLLTGGSDFHGFKSGREINIGEPSLSDKLFQKLKDEYLRRNKS
ncbi:PHP domain-containing protein [Candidatus Saganbacteria bacterium]|nr:PHP domain-containing protein [Candidatus Saganbacteria bacterium]